MNASRRAPPLAALLVTCLMAGCAGAVTNSRGQDRSVVLTSEELAKTNSDNLYDAIAKLRPEWLTNRGPTSATDMTPASVDVYMNGNRLGDADYLREMRLLDVSEVRYWNAGQASARYGMGHPRGVIEVSRE